MGGGETWDPTRILFLEHMKRGLIVCRGEAHVALQIRHRKRGRVNWARERKTGTSR